MNSFTVSVSVFLRECDIYYDSSQFCHLTSAERCGYFKRASLVDAMFCLFIAICVVLVGDTSSALVL